MAITATSVTYLFDVSIDVSECFPQISAFVDLINRIASPYCPAQLKMTANVYTLAITTDEEMTDRELGALAEMIKISVSVAVSGHAKGVTIRRGDDV